jgi:hypothetical protein
MNEETAKAILEELVTIDAHLIELSAAIRGVDIEKAIAAGVVEALTSGFVMYPSQILDAIADDTREALKS